MTSYNRLGVMARPMTIIEMWIHCGCSYSSDWVLLIIEGNGIKAGIDWSNQAMACLNKQVSDQGMVWIILGNGLDQTRL